ncbi:persulfide dioxygenase ethe1, mitochondrial-like [Plakobranchus ocellatus]|uniref:Persulfide dioxygenase ETHE1, mitochondrial n=1 Tax=Plakobranchus ocellatus TaxID=259542 RepID=A0AAV4D789_9GAST|nr:persulfide dioxygenase ethe1, mitochondrial-like [Plakobranchus ocellatus]
MRLTVTRSCRSTWSARKLFDPSGYSSLVILHGSRHNKAFSSKDVKPNPVFEGYRRIHCLANIDVYAHQYGTTFRNPAVTKCAQPSRRNFHPNVSDDSIIFRQLLDYKSYTYTYLLADAATREAILIDPVIDTVERDYRVVQELGLNLIAAVNTHVHADHITGSGEMKKRLPVCKSMIAAVSQARADVKLKEKDLIKFGQFELEVRSTPGHTNGCLSYVWHDKHMVFTGDALLIRGCGRTDFQEGSPDLLYDSVHQKIFSLPHHFQVFPAHDYTGQTMSTVGEEVKFNPRLRRSKSDFVKIMKNLQLPYPKQIDKALPANMVCGIFDEV